MKTETLNKGIELINKITFLKEKIKSFNPKNRYVYLHIHDHYGNKGGIIETYAFTPEYNNAAGYSFDGIVSDAYGIFLETVRDKMQAKIDSLELEFNNL